ncbi:MAG: hypothetical protein ACOC1X_02375, partial [Promethearchaeota archaeon]
CLEKMIDDMDFKPFIKGIPFYHDKSRVAQIANEITEYNEKPISDELLSMIKRIVKEKPDITANEVKKMIDGEKINV